MAAREQRPKTELSAIRGYVLILVASIVLLSSALIVYLYWHENTSHRLEEALNSFHLESMMRCVQIADELHHIGRAVTATEAADADALEGARVNAIHLIELHLNSARQIYGDFEHTSRFSGQVEPILRKTETQFNAIRAAFRESGKTGAHPTPARTATLIKSFSHGIEQLRRLHEIARDQIRTEAHQLNHQRSNRLLIIFGFVAILAPQTRSWLEGTLGL